MDRRCLSAHQRTLALAGETSETSSRTGTAGLHRVNRPVLAQSTEEPRRADRCPIPSAAPIRKYRLGELFAGAGGMALGASQARHADAGFVHVWANDIDADACRTLERNVKFPPGGIVRCPVEELDFGQLPSIDGLAFGFPCNDFSLVGERNGIHGRFGGLYRWGIRALRYFQPLFFVAENVSGLASSGGKRDYRLILEEMESAGYTVFPYTYRFEEYGVPQARHRIIIVGFRKTLHLSFRQPRTSIRRISCREALEHPPIADDAENNQRTAQHPRVVERLKHIKPGENAFTANLPPRLRLRMRSGATISQIYRRLDPDRPSYTVTGSGGGGTHVYHWSEHRALTNRERARLQSFPDWFVFCGGRESVRRQIGMAVPPTGAQVIFEAVLKALTEAGVSPCEY